ncbi:alpha/beta hydrolase [uncultured Kordia sp.]|uniref:alpha/beta fold hydrolase n=1 Tax=uncultured Kordia sp. TaxID=507699 RepID=UPI00260CE864|nr:alpha/beta hydrolase [uncultured Kordia sp.]
MKKLLSIVLMLTIFQVSYSQKSVEYYVTHNESKIFVKEIGKGPTLILLHGGPADNHLSFMPYAEELSKNFRVIMYDQNDAGKSTSATQKPHTAAREIETLEFLRTHLKLEKLSLVGHSWGTILSLMYAEKYPQHIHKISLISSVGTSFQYYIQFAQNLQKKFTQEDIKKMQALSSKPNVKPSELLDIYLPYYFFDNANIKKLTKTDINFSVNREILTDISQKFNLRGKEPIFKFPILVLQGVSDLLTPEDIKKAFLNFPDVEITAISKAGHFPYVENPNEVTQKLTTFFN